MAEAAVRGWRGRGRPARGLSGLRGPRRAAHRAGSWHASPILVSHLMAPGACVHWQEGRLDVTKTTAERSRSLAPAVPEWGWCTAPAPSLSPTGPSVPRSPAPGGPVPSQGPSCTGVHPAPPDRYRRPLDTCTQDTGRGQPPPSTSVTAATGSGRSLARHSVICGSCEQRQLGPQGPGQGGGQDEVAARSDNGDTGSSLRPHPNQHRPQEFTKSSHVTLASPQQGHGFLASTVKESEAGGWGERDTWNGFGQTHRCVKRGQAPDAGSLLCH